jgi:ubiquinone/menaquinone biosynthesis C-methylase UbiE
MNFSNITDHEFWDKKYSRFRPHYYFFDPYYGRDGLLNRSLKPWIKDAQNVLEIGCGSSRYLMFFNLVAGMETYGIDFAKRGLWNLQMMARDHSIKHHLHLGDMFEMDLEDKKFDLVFHSGLIEHFSDLDRVFDRCHFFCRKNGLMIFLVPNMHNIAWSWHEKICPNNYKAHIKYRKSDIINSLNPYFTLIKIRNWGYPQLYAGSPPETFPAFLLKYINIGLMLCVSCFSIRYKGSTSNHLSSTWLFICRAK